MEAKIKKINRVMLSLTEQEAEMLQSLLNYSSKVTDDSSHIPVEFESFYSQLWDELKELGVKSITS